MVPGTWCLAPSARYLLAGAEYLAPGTWNLVQYARASICLHMLAYTKGSECIPGAIWICAYIPVIPAYACICSCILAYMQHHLHPNKLWERLATDRTDPRNLHLPAPATIPANQPPCRFDSLVHRADPASPCESYKTPQGSSTGHNLGHVQLPASTATCVRLPARRRLDKLGVTSTHVYRDLHGFHLSSWRVSQGTDDHQR